MNLFPVEFDMLTLLLRCYHYDVTMVPGGAYNCTLNYTVDKNHMEPHAVSTDALKCVQELHGLLDTWRSFVCQAVYMGKSK